MMNVVNKFAAQPALRSALLLVVVLEAVKGRRTGTVPAELSSNDLKQLAHWDFAVRTHLENWVENGNATTPLILKVVEK